MNLDLIRIQKKDVNSEFVEIPNKFHNKADEAPSLDEISKEVETVRKSRYQKQENNPHHESMDKFFDI